MHQQNVVDAVNDCAYILDFISEVIAPLPAPQALDLSHKALNGLSLILDQTSQRLVAVTAALDGCSVQVEVAP